MANSTSDAEVLPLGSHGHGVESVSVSSFSPASATGKRSSVKMPSPPPPPPPSQPAGNPGLCVPASKRYCSSASSGAASAITSSRREPSSTAGDPPAFLGNDWMFECWTGPTMRFVAYDEATQMSLRTSFNQRGGIVHVEIDGQTYEISIKFGDLWQNNPKTGGAPRRVRLSPRGGLPE